MPVLYSNHFVMRSRVMPLAQAIRHQKQHSLRFEQRADARKRRGTILDVKQHIAGQHRVKALLRKAGIKQIRLRNGHILHSLRFGFFLRAAHHFAGNVDRAHGLDRGATASVTIPVPQAKSNTVSVGLRYCLKRSAVIS